MLLGYGFTALMQSRPKIVPRILGSWIRADDLDSQRDLLVLWCEYPEVQRVGQHRRGANVSTSFATAWPLTVKRRMP